MLLWQQQLFVELSGAAADCRHQSWRTQRARSQSITGIVGPKSWGSQLAWSFYRIASVRLASSSSPFIVLAAALAVTRLHSRRCIRCDHASLLHAADGQQEMATSNPKVIIAETADRRGKFLRAKVSMDIGEVIIREPPLFVHGMPSAATEDEVQGVVAAFNRLGPSVRHAILRLFTTDFVPALKDSAGYAAASGEQRWLLGILKLNSVDLPGRGAAVFEELSRANHSCQPNAAFKFESDFCSLVAMRPLAVGDEVTISYIKESCLMMPIGHRKSMLSNWNFDCRCPRCASFADDTRGFSCPACGESGIFPDLSGDWLPCRACNHLHPADELQRTGSHWWGRYNDIAPLSKRSELIACQFQRGISHRPKATRPQEWMSDVVTLHRDLVAAPAPAPAADGHWIGYEVSTMATEAHLWRGEFEEAAAAAALRRQYVHRILAGASSWQAQVAKACEEVARSSL